MFLYPLEASSLKTVNRVHYPSSIFFDIPPKRLVRSLPVQDDGISRHLSYYVDAWVRRSSPTEVSQPLEISVPSSKDGKVPGLLLLHARGGRMRPANFPCGPYLGTTPMKLTHHVGFVDKVENVDKNQ